MYLLDTPPKHLIHSTSPTNNRLVYSELPLLPSRPKPPQTFFFFYPQRNSYLCRFLSLQGELDFPRWCCPCWKGRKVMPLNIPSSAGSSSLSWGIRCPKAMSSVAKPPRCEHTRQLAVLCVQVRRSDLLKAGYTIINPLLERLRLRGEVVAQSGDLQVSSRALSANWGSYVTHFVLLLSWAQCLW